MKKLISILIVAAMLIMILPAIVIADENPENGYEGIMPEFPLWSYYMSVSGTIVSIDEFDPDNEFTVGWRRLNVEDEDGNPKVFVISDSTFFPFEDELAVGDEVTGFYLRFAPMISIYPPQYTIAVLVSGMPDNLNIQVDRFFEWEEREGYLLAQSGNFAFTVDEDTEIVTADPDIEFYPPLSGRRLVVLYDVSTRSIPELATAIKVIALFEEAVPLLPDTGMMMALDVSEMPIIVNDEEIEAPAAFMAEDGVTIMVPLRAIAEALGFTVTWHGDEWAVSLDDSIKMFLDVGYYLIDGDELTAVEFAPVPILVTQFTYVPMLFFVEVAGMANAFAFEGRIEFHRYGERME